nr:ATP-dependent protease [Nitrosomonas sp.]
RVTESHQRQLNRQGKTNSQLSVKEIDQHCALDTASENLLKQAISRLNLSARAYHRILKVARTIADLAGIEKINNQHIAEAIQYRRLDKG